MPCCGVGDGRVQRASLGGNCSFQFARFGTDSHSLHVFIILVMILHMKIKFQKGFMKSEQSEGEYRVIQRVGACWWWLWQCFHHRECILSSQNLAKDAMSLVSVSKNALKNLLVGKIEKKCFHWKSKKPAAAHNHL